jgi:hypothetical protein
MMIKELLKKLLHKGQKKGQHDDPFFISIDHLPEDYQQWLETLLFRLARQYRIYQSNHCLIISNESPDEFS